MRLICQKIKSVQLFLLLPASLALAQSPPQFRLEASPPVSRSQSVPVLDQTGVCVGWFETSSSILLDASGRAIFKSAGKILKPENAVSKCKRRRANADLLL